MAKFHVNGDGEAGECRATKGGCPFGDEDSHYTSAEAARAAFESSMNPFASGARDFAAIAPQWAGKLPAAVEQKILAKTQEFKELVDAVDSGKLEVKYTDISRFLDEPVTPYRERGSWFVKASEVDIEPTEQEGEYLIAMHSRQGGGNRECYCYENDGGHDDGCLVVSNDELEENPQFAGYLDDDMDSTYTTHYFRGGWTEADVTKHDEQRKLFNEYRKAKMSLESIASGKAPPWSVLSEGGVVDVILKKDGLKIRKPRLDEQITKKTAKRTLAKNAIEKLKSGQALDEQEVNELNALGRGWEFRNANRDIHSWSERSKTLKKAEAMAAEATQLPDGDLKEYLLGDRGTGSYEVTEKKKGRNVRVTKTYQKGTLLGKNVEEAKDRLQSAERTLKPTRELLDKISIDNDPREDIKERKELDQKLKEVWGAGWPGRAQDLPAMPKEF